MTYLNISPAPNTWGTIEAQGFRCIRQGWFLSFPVLSRSAERVRILPLAAAPRELAERTLLEEHAALGCKVIVVEKAGEHFPFVFAPHQILRRSMSTLILTYCRDFADYVRFAGAIGRYFLMRGIPSIVVDSYPRVRELTGMPIERARRYYARGTHPPRNGDIAYTEIVFLGT